MAGMGYLQRLFTWIEPEKDGPAIPDYDCLVSNICVSVGANEMFHNVLQIRC